MKKFSILLKKILVPFATLGLIVSVAKVSATPDTAVATKADAESSSEIYRISHTNDSIDILLNANLRAYTSVRKSTIRGIMDAGMLAIKDIAKSQLTLATSTTGATLPFRTIQRGSTNTMDLVKMFSDIADLQMRNDETGEVLPGKVGQFVDGSSEYDSSNVYSVFAQYYFSRFYDEHAPATAVEEQQFVDNVISAVTSEFVELGTLDEEFTDQSTREAEITNLVSGYVNGAITAYHTNGDVAPEISLDEITTILALTQDLGNGDKTEIQTKVGNLIDALGKDNVSKDIIDTINGALDANKGSELTEFLKTVDSTTITTIAKNVDIDTTKVNMVKVVETIGIANLIDVVDKIGVDGAKAIFDAFKVKNNDIINLISDTITISDIIKAIQTVKVNGNVILANHSPSATGIKQLLLSLPRPSDLKSRSDNDMNIVFDVSIVTALGNFNFDLKVGFFGDCSNIRKILAIIDDTIVTSHINGVWGVEVNVPGFVTRIYELLCETEENKGILSDDLKHELFDIVFKSFEEIKDYLKDKTLSDILEYFKGVDYEAAVATFLSAETLNEVFTTGKFTQSRIERAIDLFMKLLNKVGNITYDDIMGYVNKIIDASALEGGKIEALYNKLQALIQKVVNKGVSYDMLMKLADPEDETYTNDTIYRNIDKLMKYESLFDRIKTKALSIFSGLSEKYTSKSIMSFYKGNSVLNFTGILPLPIKRILNKIPMGGTIIDLFPSFFDSLPTSLNVNLTGNLRDINSVTYNMPDGTTKTGLLPVGADVSFFANIEQYEGHNIIKWVDADGNEVKEMPKADVVLTPVIDFDVSITASFSDVYTGVAKTISVTTTRTGSYSYKWYKDDVLLNGETGSSINVTNVADSGAYYAIVEDTKCHTIHTTDVCNAEITPATIETNDIGWSTSQFTYDGEDKSMSLTNVPATLTVVYSYADSVGGTASDHTAAISKKDAGTYAVVAKLSCDANHLIDGVATTKSLESKDLVIDQAVVEVPQLEWNYTSEFVFDGNEKSVNVQVPNGVNNDFLSKVDVVLGGTYKATQPGDYTATYTITMKSEYTANYKFSDGSVLSGQIAWSIVGGEIHMPELTWDYTEEFKYDGVAHSVNVVTTGVDPNVLSMVDITVNENSKTAVGEYTATYSVAIKSQYSNYSFDQSSVTSGSLNWKIVNNVIHMPELTWDYVEAFKYDGVAHSVNVVTTGVDPNVLSMVDITVNENSKIDVGNYTATYSVALKPAYQVGYVFDTTSVLSGNLNWSINKAVIHMPEFTWDYTVPFTYDGTVKSINLVPNGVSNDILNLVDIKVSNNKKTAVGDYTATYTVSLKSAYAGSYKFDDTSVLEGSLNWSIVKSVIYVPELNWNYSSAFVYDGEMHTVDVDTSLIDKDYLKFLDIKLSENKAIRPGEYVASYEVSLKPEYASSYELASNSVLSGTLNWKITENIIEMPSIAWNYSEPLTYNGKEQSVDLMLDQIDPSILKYVNIKRSGTYQATEVGTYCAEYQVSIKAEYLAGYQFSETSVTSGSLEWQIAPKAPVLTNVFASSESTYGQVNAYVNATNGIDNTVKLAAPVQKDVVVNDAMTALFEKSEVSVMNAYELSFKNADGSTYVDGVNTYDVKLLVTNYEEAEGTTYKVVEIKDDGTIVEVSSTINNGYAEIQVDHLGKYAVLKGVAINEPEPQKINVPTIVFIGVIGLLQIAFIVLLIVIIRKILNKSKAPKKDTKVAK